MVDLKMISIKLTAVFILFAASQASAGRSKLVCYFSNEAQHRPQPFNQTPQDVDPYLCSHIVYAFAGVDAGTATVKFNEANDITFIGQLTNMKNQNRRLKVLLAVKGDSTDMGDVAGNPAKRLNFVSDLTTKLRLYNLDGVDIHFTYPSSDQKDSFSALIKDIKTSFDNEAPNARKRLLVTACLSASRDVMDTGYDIKALGDNLDFVNIEAFNMNEANSATIQLHSALFARQSGDRKNQEWVISEFITRGMKASKMILGIPVFGKTYKVCNSGIYDPGAQACGAGDPGSYTKKAGMRAYYELCYDRKLFKYQRAWSRKQRSPYMYLGNQWCGYDDKDSLSYKINFMNTMDLGGVMVWDLSLDDFKGVACGHGRYPVIGTINRMLWMKRFHGIIKRIVHMTLPPSQTTTTPAITTPSTTTTTTTTTTPAPTTPSTTTTTTAAPAQPGQTGWQCPDPTIVNIYADVTDCVKYIVCQYGNKIELNCNLNPAERLMRFDTVLKQCVTMGTPAC